MPRMSGHPGCIEAEHRLHRVFTIQPCFVCWDWTPALRAGGQEFNVTMYPLCIEGLGLYTEGVYLYQLGLLWDEGALLPSKRGQPDKLVSLELRF